eukprot:jgi/Tetstr1/456145/TSEL_042914.t1
MYNEVTFAPDVVRECCLRPGTENIGSPDFTELLEFYNGCGYDANIASAAKKSARHRFGGGPRRSGDPNRHADPRQRRARQPSDTVKETQRPGARGNIEALHGTNNWDAKVLGLLSTSLMASTYSNYEGKIRLFAELYINEEGISPLDCTETTCVRHIAWIAERITIGPG